MMFKHAMVASLVSVALTACGGGSSGGSDSTSNTTATGSSLVTGDGGGGKNNYTAAAGNTASAQLTSINAYDFVTLLLAVDSEALRAALGIFPRSENPEGNDSSGDLMKSMSKIVDKAVEDKLAAKGDTAEREINSTYSCEDGGNYTVSGTLDNSTLQGTLDVNYNDCIVDSLMKRGKGILTVNKISSDLAVDFAIGYNGLSVISATDFTLYTGSQRVNRTINNSMFTRAEVTNDLNRFSQTYDHYTLDNTIITYGMSSSAGSGSGTQVSGQLCDGAYGCVTIATRIPFKSGSGELTMTGINNSKLKVYASQGYLVYQLDEGDGSYQEPIYYQ